MRHFLIAICLINFCLSACAQSGSEELVFAVGGAPSELDFWEQLVAEFETETRIPVRILRQPSDTDQQRQVLVVSLKAQMRDPDVFLMDIAWMGLFTSAGWLAPLDEEIDDMTFFSEIVDKTDRYKGRLMALPVYMDAGMLYFRKDLIADPPETWSSLVSTAREIQAAKQKSNPGFYGFVWTGAQNEGLITVFMEFAGARGGFIQKQGKIFLNTPVNTYALDLMRKMIRLDRISPPNTYTDMKEEAVRMYFQRGNALFERNWPYAWALHQSPASPVRGKTGVAPVPGPETGTRSATLGGFHVGVSRFSDKKSRAFKFVKFITSYKIQKRMALAMGWNPGRRDLYNDPDILKKAPHFRALKKVFEKARPRPLVPYYSQVSAVAQKHINRVLAGYADPEKALADADREIAALLARYGIE